MVDLTRDSQGRVRARLLDLVPSRDARGVHFQPTLTGEMPSISETQHDLFVVTSSPSPVVIVVRSLAQELVWGLCKVGRAPAGRPACLEPRLSRLRGEATPSFAFDRRLGCVIADEGDHCLEQRTRQSPLFPARNGPQLCGQLDSQFACARGTGVERAPVGSIS